METAEIWKAFMSKTCAGCGGTKKPRQAFCNYCYRELPLALRSSLWKKFNDGFDQAYMGCLSWFRTHPFQGEHRAEQTNLFFKKGES
jgi:hypothetical protein